MAIEPITLAAAAAGYILKALSKTEGAKTASKELSTAIWEWMRPIFLKEQPELVEEVEQKPPTTETEKRLTQAIEQKAASDPQFLAQLACRTSDQNTHG